MSHKSKAVKQRMLGQAHQRNPAGLEKPTITLSKRSKQRPGGLKAVGIRPLRNTPDRPNGPTSPAPPTPMIRTSFNKTCHRRIHQSTRALRLFGSNADFVSELGRVGIVRDV